MNTQENLAPDGPAALVHVRNELRRPFAAVVAFSIAINLLALTVPLYMTQVFDRVLTSYSVETLVMLSVLALGLIGVFVALDNLRGQVLTRAALEGGAVAGRTTAGGRDPRPARGTHGSESSAARPGRVARLRHQPGHDGVLRRATGAALRGGHLPGSSGARRHRAAGRPGHVRPARMPTKLATGKRADAAGKASNALLHTADQQTRNADVIHAMGLMQALRQRWRTAQDSALGEQLLTHEQGGRYQVAMRYTRLALQIATLAFGAALVIAGEITAGMMFACIDHPVARVAARRSGGELVACIVVGAGELPANLRNLWRAPALRAR